MILFFFQIYLDGELPPGFNRLQNSVKEKLDEFRAINKESIQYEFINPAESPDTRTRNEIFRQIFEKGLVPSNLTTKNKDGGISQKIIFPGSIVIYQNKEVPVNFLSSKTSANPELNLNNAIESIEYGLVMAIKKLIAVEKLKIAFIEGHKQLVFNIKRFYKSYSIAQKS